MGALEEDVEMESDVTKEGLTEETTIRQTMERGADGGRIQEHSQEEGPERNRYWEESG